MNHWIHPELPCFAVVGRVNTGKSAVLATLLEIDDDSIIRVSPTPGETTSVQVLPLVLDGKERMRFLDTPGFQQAVAAKQAIQHIAGERTPNLDDLRIFVSQYANEFPDECLLLQPLIEGAGVLYIVDPSKPLRDSFLAEMEILRWTGRPRLALMNQKDESTSEEAEWRNRLGATFNLVRTFNAHHARYAERLRLLRSLLDIEESHRNALEHTIALIGEEWQQREEQSAEIIIGFLESSLLLRSAKTVPARELSTPARQEKIREQLAIDYYQALAKLEHKASKELLELYRHHLLKADLRENSFQGLDLESRETWKKWGLSRHQLAAAGALAGAIAGGSIDIGTGGLTHGIATAFFTLTGAGAAYFKGNQLPSLNVALDGIKVDATEQRSISVGPPGNANFPWILLDSMLLIHARILTRAHGRRDLETLNIEDNPQGFSRDLAKQSRATLTKWFESCLKSSPNRALEPEVYEIILQALNHSRDKA